MSSALRTGDFEHKPRKRSPIGTIIRPRQQLRYALMLVGGGIIAQSVVIGWFAYFFHQTITDITTTHHLDPEIGTVITNSITASLVTIMLVATAIASVAILIGLKLSHRIYGPLVPFTRHIEQLKNGNYSSRVRLRKNDDLIEIQTALNDLAETLEHRAKTKHA